MLTLEVLGAASELPAAEWDALAERGVHLHHWVRTAEEGTTWEPRHLVVREAGRLRLIVPAYLMRGSLYGDLHDRWLGPARRLAPALGLRLRPTLDVSPPISTVSDPLGAAGLDGETAERILAALEDVARRERLKAVVWHHLGPAADVIVRRARDRGYAEAFTGSSAVLPLTWPSLDAYVASRRKTVRRTVRAELRAVEESGLRLETTHDFAAAAPAMDALYRRAFAERNGESPPLTTDFFARLAARPQPGCWAQLAWEGPRLVGMSVNLLAGGTVDGGFSAFDAAWRGGPLYYRDLVYEPLRVGCAAGAHRLDLGTTALYPKLLRGALLEPRRTLVRGIGPARHAALAALGRAVDLRNRRKERRTLAALGRHAGIPVAAGDTAA